VNSTGSTFNASETWSTTAFAGSLGTLFADVNADGRADAIALQTNGVFVRRSTGSSFLASETWSTTQFFGQGGTAFADVDGDGKADAIAFSNSGIFVRRSTGSGLAPIETWSSGAVAGNVATLFTDATADGAADMIAVNTDGVWMRRSNRFNFGSSELLADQTSAGTPQVADLSGDKRADITEVTSSGILVTRSRERVINLRFVQISGTTSPILSETQIDTALATANDVYKPLGVSFVKVGSHLVTSSALADLMVSDCQPGQPCGAPVSEVAKLKDPFNPSCDIGNVSNVKESDQLMLVSTRCGFRGEIPVWIVRTVWFDPNDGLTKDYASVGYFPQNVVLMHPGDMGGSGALMSHEIGHFFGLPHVWQGGGFNTQTQTQEGLSMFWDLVYRTSGTSIIPFANKAEAAASESQLRIIQTADPENNGWFCPSGDPNKPCPPNPVVGTLGFRIPDATGATQVFYTGSNLLKGLGLRLPNNDPTLNTMSYNYPPVLQRTPSFSLSQMEQMHRVMTFPTQSGIQTAGGTNIGAGRDSLGRIFYNYGPRVFDAGDSRGYTGDMDWAGGEFKGECAANELGMGLSTSADGLSRAHSLLCASTSPVANFTAVQTTVNVTSSDFGFGIHGAADWDAGFFKGECNSDAVVTGLAQSPSGALNHFRCSSVAATGTSCRARVISGANNQETPGAGFDWAFGYFKGECGQGSAVAGVSRSPSTGAVHAVLCCDFATM
jgi:hypothetical protein